MQSLEVYELYHLNCSRDTQRPIELQVQQRQHKVNCSFYLFLSKVIHWKRGRL